MKQLLTKRECTIVELADRLAQEFAQRAGEHDRDGSFPFENYGRMREEGYLGLTVPEELGGMGASLRELMLAQERLATGCGSTALASTMHVSPLGQLASLWRRDHDPALERFLRECATGEIIYASMTAERGHSILLTSNTVAENVDGGYRVSGDKIFGTESSICTNFTCMARVDDADGGPRVIFFRMRRDDPGMITKDTWDTMGMRATQSNDFMLRDVFVPAGDVFHSYPVGHFDALMVKTVWGWAMPCFGAVYLGIAAGAMEWTRQMLLKRGSESSPQIQRLFAEMEVLLETARGVLYRHAAQMEDDRLAAELPVQDAMAHCVLAKYVAANNALAIVDHALEAAGGMAYYKRAPLERMYRDVRAGPIMPFNNLEAMDLFGRNALGIEIAPSIPLAESGHDSRAKSDSAAETSGRIG